MPSTGLVFCPLVGEGGWMDGGYTSGVAVVSLLCRDGEGVVCLGIGLAIVRLCTTRAIFNPLSDLAVPFPLPCDESTALRRGAANGGAGNAADKSCLSGPINEGMSSQLRCLRRKTIARRLMEEISCISRVL